MRSIRLVNFRSLADTGKIELKPLMVLVGSNGSGKSSFLRFFPLLRQTAETSTRSPLLWYGRYVDFGDFSQAVCRTAKAPEITVELEIEHRHPFTLGTRGLKDDLSVKPFQFNVSVKIEAVDGKTQVRQCLVTCNHDRCIIDFDNAQAITRFQVNDIDVLSIERLYAGEHSSNHLIPRLPYYNYAHAPSASLLGRLVDEMRMNAHAKSPVHRITDLASELPYDGNRDTTGLALFDESVKWKKGAFLDRLGRPDHQIHSLLFATLMPDILSHASRHLEDEGRGVIYIGPFRNAPERFYRQQELSTNQIEPHGENLAMFLHALTELQQHDFSRFVQEHFGFAIRVEVSNGSHVALMIQEANGSWFNLIDMGYGFSQVLPVIAQSWAAQSGMMFSERDSPTTMVAIEEPELHLHPSHQAKLADMLVSATKALKALSNGNTCRFLIETHSEALVSRLGELVERGDVDPADISVLLFEKDPATGLTSVRQSLYAPDGTLTNWPVGFFAP